MSLAGSSRAESKTEKSYTPVDIGDHIWADGISEAKHSQKDFFEVFQLGEKRSLEFSQKTRASLDQQKKKFIKDFNLADQKQKDHFFHLDPEQLLSWRICEFSKSKVKVGVEFIVGHSRWHHYYKRLSEMVFSRNESIDKALGLPELEKQYGFSFKGVEHGTPVRDMQKLLGKKFKEYPGQSEQFRQLYYPDHDIEIVIQDQVVKYLRRGVPAWIASVH